MISHTEMKNVRLFLLTMVGESRMNCKGETVAEMHWSELVTHLLDSELF